MMDTLTVSQAAKMLGVTPALIRIYIRADLFPGAVKVRGTRWQIPRAAVELFDGTNIAGAFSTKPKREPFCKLIIGSRRWLCTIFGGEIAGTFLRKDDAETLAEMLNKAAEQWAKNA